jgi:hypothetical protein
VLDVVILIGDLKGEILVRMVGQIKILEIRFQRANQALPPNILM